MLGGVSLLGREVELRDVVNALDAQGRCLISGPGGVGKTALARAVVERLGSAARASDRRVIWVDVEPCASLDMVLLAVLRSCDAALHPGDDAAAAVASVLSDVVGVVVLTVLLLVFARRHGGGYLADRSFTSLSSYPLGFCNALILGMYTFTGYDASAHMSEETHDPARRAPIGILTAVGVSAVAGYAYLVGLTLAIDDLPALAKDDHAPLTILQHGLGPTAGRWGMGLAIFAMWFCGLSSVTSASRTLYAFSRDDGLPFSAAIRKVLNEDLNKVAAQLSPLANKG